MRRFLSYFILSMTTLFLVGVNFLSVIGGLNANLEFNAGREMVFRISDKSNEDSEFTSNEAATEIAETMIARLENALITKYEVLVEGNDQIRVTVAEASETRYTRLQKYLGFDAEFTLCTTTEVCATPEQMFDGQTARIEYKGQNPFVVFSVKDLTYLKEVIVTEAGGPESTEGELLLWAGKLEEDSFSASLENPEVAEKILLRIPVANMWWDEETQTELAYFVSPSKFGSANENNVFAPNVVAQANEEAIYFRNLFNAGELPFAVEFLYSQPVVPAIESLLSFEGTLTLAGSQTILALVLGLSMMVIVLAIVYRIGALGIIATSTLSVFLTLFAFISLNIEFSSSALLGFITISIFGLLTSLLYLTFIRREIYQGRSFKKAHVEANAKLLPLTFDMTVVGLIFGLLIYIFAGNLSQSFAVILMIGSLINFGIVYLGNQILYSQLFQSNFIQEKPHFFNLQVNLIPDVSKDEKPVYFGRFATRDFTSKGSFLSPLTLLTGVLSITAMLVLTFVNIPVFQAPLNSNPTRLYLEVKEFSRFETTADVKTLLIDFLKVNDEPLTLSNDTIQVHEFIRFENDVEVPYTIFVAELNVPSTSEPVYSFNDGENPSISNPVINDLLIEVVNVIYEDDQVMVAGFYQAEPVTNQPTVLEVTLGTLFALLIVGVYLTARMGIIKSMTAILISSALGLMTLGIFMATRLPSPTILVLSQLTIMYLSLILILVIFAQSKVALLAGQTSATLDEQTLSLKKASSQSAASIFLVLLSLLYPGLTFLAIGPLGLQSLFSALLIASALMALIITSILPHTYKPMYRLLKGVNQALSLNWLPKGKTKVVASEQPRSNEPQEATYIGIND